MFFSFLKTQIFASFFTASLAIFLVTVLVLFVFLKIKKLSINKATWGLPLLFLVVAIGSYNLPEKYQLLNLINVSENTNTNQDLMNQTPAAILGEETNSPKDALQCVSTGCTNLYQLLTTNAINSQPLKLGGILLTKKGELFLLSKSVVSDSIKAGETNVQIDTTMADKEAKIYVTPVGNTFGQVLYVDEIIDGEYFKVKLNEKQNDNIRFNWLIVK